MKNGYAKVFNIFNLFDTNKIINKLTILALKLIYRTIDIFYVLIIFFSIKIVDGDVEINS